MSCRFAYRRYALPLRVPVRTASGRWTVREGLILRVENDAGDTGFGEVAPIPEFHTETVAEAEAALRVLDGRIAEAQIATFPARLRCVRQGLGSALRECRAEAPEAATASLPVAALLPAGRDALAAAASRVEVGFRTFKWKVGVAGNDVEMGLLDDLLALLPGGARLRLDANGAWDRRRAERWLERCAERPIEFIEQPVAADARNAEDLLLGLAGDYPTPLSLDESLADDADVERWLAAGWPGLFTIKPSLLADPESVLARLAAAKARVVFSSALETAVGARSALRLAFAWKGEPRALGFGVWPLFADARFDGPAAVPVLRAEDIAAVDLEAVWNALS